jgi:hypothetical protein
VRDRLAAKGIDVKTDSALPSAFAAMVAATGIVYGLLFGVGYYLYGQLREATLSFVLAGIAMFVIFRLWPKLGMDRSTEQPIERQGKSN